MAGARSQGHRVDLPPRGSDLVDRARQVVDLEGEVLERVRRRIRRERQVHLLVAGPEPCTRQAEVGSLGHDLAGVLGVDAVAELDEVRQSFLGPSLRRWGLDDILITRLGDRQRRPDFPFHTQRLVLLPQEQEQRKSQRKGGGGSGEAGQAETTEKTEKLKEEMDEILDEIDSVLEENAEEFIKSYVQKGGE